MQRASPFSCSYKAHPLVISLSLPCTPDKVCTTASPLPLYSNTAPYIYRRLGLLSHGHVLFIVCRPGSHHPARRPLFFVWTSPPFLALRTHQYTAPSSLDSMRLPPYYNSYLSIVSRPSSNLCIRKLEPLPWPMRTQNPTPFSVCTLPFLCSLDTPFSVPSKIAKRWKEISPLGRKRPANTRSQPSLSLNAFTALSACQQSLTYT